MAADRGTRLGGPILARICRITGASHSCSRNSRNATNSELKTTIASKRRKIWESVAKPYLKRWLVWVSIISIFGALLQLRSNCDFSGTTPPTESLHHQHPSLLSSLSFPGTTPPSQDSVPKNYQTVPPSPNVNQVVSPPLGMQGAVYRSGILKSSKSDSVDSMSSDKSTERPSTLPVLTNLAPLTGKPPQSPTQTSPRLSRHLRDKEGESDYFLCNFFFCFLNCTLWKYCLS